MQTNALSQKNKLFSDYMQSLEKKESLNVLLSCTGWKEPTHENAIFSSAALMRLFTPDKTFVQQGGYFIRYNGTGICLNPGRHFFDRFCAAGFHLWEIDYVIVSKPSTDASFDLELLHTINRELNSTLISYDQEPHLIRYLLHEACFSSHVAMLKPFFREERESVMRLEPFADCEELLLSDTIRLLYCTGEGQNVGLDLRFDFLQNLPQNLAQRSIGYSTRRSWRKTSFFTPCSTLISASVPEQECVPELQLLLLSEFSAEWGDRRLEMAKEARQSLPGCIVLPLDSGVQIGLDGSSQIHTGQKKVACQEVSVLRSEEFGRLTYLSSHQIL